MRSALARSFSFAFFVFAYAWSWAWWLPLALSHRSASTRDVQLRILIGTFGPLLSASVLVAQQDGAGAVARLLLSGFRLRISRLVLLVVLTLPLSVTALSYRVASGQMARVPISLF